MTTLPFARDLSPVRAMMPSVISDSSIFLWLSVAKRSWEFSIAFGNCINKFFPRNLNANQNKIIPDLSWACVYRRKKPGVLNAITRIAISR